MNPQYKSVMIRCRLPDNATLETLKRLLIEIPNGMSYLIEEKKKLEEKVMLAKALVIAVEGEAIKELMELGRAFSRANAEKKYHPAVTEAEAKLAEFSLCHKGIQDDLRLLEKTSEHVRKLATLEAIDQQSQGRSQGVSPASGAPAMRR